MLLIYSKHSSVAFKRLLLWFATLRISRLCWKVFFFGDYRRIRVRSYRPRWSVSSLTAIINRIPVSIFVFQRMKNNINAGRTSSGKFFTVSFRWVCFTWQGLRLWSQPIYNYRTCLSGGEIVCFFYRGHPRFWDFYSTIPVDVSTSHVTTSWDNEKLSFYC